MIYRRNFWTTIGCALFYTCMTACGGGDKNNVAETKWSYRGFGGGGAMFFPAVSPFNTNFALVACDMTGSFVTHDGGASWRMFNLRAPAHFFVFDPVDSNTVYANGLALFKSTDKGNTWTVLYPAASEITAVISKGDHAENVIVTKDSARRHVQALAIDPSDTRKLYAAIAIDDKAGLYVSSDGGGSWKKETDVQTPVRNIFIDPSSPPGNRTIYVATAGGILLNRNGQWQLHKTPAGVGELTIYTAGYDSFSKKFIVYAISGKSYFHPGDDASGIFFTDDGGVTWDNRQDGISSLNRPAATFPNGAPSPQARDIPVPYMFHMTTSTRETPSPSAWQKAKTMERHGPSFGRTVCPKEAACPRQISTTDGSTTDTALPGARTLSASPLPPGPRTSAMLRILEGQ
jgi:photosystem II stability/assembly factor-like uncharacterized protein